MKKKTKKGRLSMESIRKRLTPKPTARDLLQHGQNLERAVWRQRLKKLDARLNDHTLEVNYTMNAYDVLEDLKAFADAREKRTRGRRGGA